MRSLDEVQGNLEKYSDEELLEYAENSVGSDRVPNLPSIPYAFRRLAEMVRKARKSQRQ